MTAEQVGTFLSHPWVVSLITTCVLVPVGWIIKTIIEKNIRKDLDARVEILKSQLRREEQRFSDLMKQQESEISSLRDAAFSNMVQTHSAIISRRVHAVENIWKTLHARPQLKFLAQTISRFKIDLILEYSKSNDDRARKMRELGDQFWTMFGLDKIDMTDNAIAERPFLTNTAWVIFTAYQSIIMLPILQLSALRMGVGPEIIKDRKEILDAVKSVLPHRTEFIDKFGDAALSQLLDELESLLLAEFSKIVGLGQNDDGSTELSSHLVKLSQSLKATALSPQLAKAVSELSADPTTSTTL